MIAPYRFVEYDPMLFSPRFILGLSFCILAGTLTAQAEVISYGDFDGAQFIYQNVEESSSTDPAGLFGAPLLSGDALVFTPTNFRAEASGANDVDITDAALGTLVVAKDGSSIDTLDIVEFGDFTLTGTGTADTLVGAAGYLFASIVEIDNMPVTDVIDLTATMDLSASADTVNYVPDADGVWDLTTDPGTNLWTGAVSLDIQGALQSLGLGGSATKVLVTFDNTLIAQSEEASDAFIAKKRQITVTAHVVPEPSTIALILVGLAGLGVLRIKRR